MRTEDETIILLNAGDMAKGFVTFSTTILAHYKRMLRKIGGKENMISESVCKDRRGNILCWNVKLPRACISRSNLGLRNPKSVTRNSIANLKRPDRPVPEKLSSRIVEESA